MTNINLFIVEMIVILFLFSVEDIKRKSIPVIWITASIALYVAEIIVLLSWEHIGFDYKNILFSIIMASVFSIGCFLSKLLGVGDALIIGVTSLFVGYKIALATFLIALLGISIIACILLLLKIMKRKDTIPFVPFYAVSFLGVIACV